MTPGEQSGPNAPALSLEEELSRERNLLRSVIDNVPDFIHAKDTRGRYILNNHAHTRLLAQASSRDVLGKTVFDFFPPAFAEGYNEGDLEVFATGQPILDRVEPTLAVDGSERWISSTKVPLRDAAGKVIGLVYIGRDITEQKRSQEQLEQANRDLLKSRGELVRAMNELAALQLQLIEAEKMKLVGRLAAGVAHEVKNPLAIIGMGVDYLAQQPSDDPNLPGILDEMNDAVRRADAVIRELLDFSAPKNLHMEPANLNGLVRHALLLTRGQLCQSRLHVVEELDPGLPPVRLDPMKIEQVLVNLFTNALHAMEGGGGGTLTIRTSSRQLTGVGENIGQSEAFLPGDSLVVLEVLDTGHGLPEASLGKLFEPFFTTKPTGKGTGLGLTVTKTIVDLHGGTIDIRSRPEGGACVTVQLRAEVPL